MSEKAAALNVPQARELLEAMLSIPGSTGDAYSRFHPYSIRNLGFLALQGCPMEPVATYKKWTELGRQVKRGSKAYSILRPIQVKLKDEQEDEDSPKFIQRFKVVRALFNYSQTAGDDLPPYEPPAWSVDRALGALAITRVPFEMHEGNVGGYAVGRELAVNPMAPNPLRTSIHEIAHIDLGHTDTEGIEQYRSHRGTFEVEAETTAHIALKEIGALDDETASVSRGYIQGWLGDRALSDSNIKRILTSSSRIVKAGFETFEE